MATNSAFPATTDGLPQAAWFVPAAARDNGRLLSQRHISFRARPHAPEPGHGATPVARAWPLAAAVKRGCCWRQVRLCADLDRKRLTMLNPLAPVRRPEFMLAQQEPYPGVVVDRRWNLLPEANRGAAAMVTC